ncbi:MAG: hypothetical protein HY823_01960 [Acidobacteria bacterium]|nr:hypothetical protein [Acidobacteriota bacterium]
MNHTMRPLQGPRTLLGFRAPLLLLTMVSGPVLTAAGPPALARPVLTVFGVRLGEPLKSQCRACPEEQGASGRLPDQPCWVPDPVIRGVHTVRLSLGTFEDLGRLEVRRVREVGGVVVEVEVEFPP